MLVGMDVATIISSIGMLLIDIVIALNYVLH